MNKGNIVSLVAGLLALAIVAWSHFSTGAKIDAKADLAALQATYEQVAPVVGNIADEVEKLQGVVSDTESRIAGMEKKPAVDTASLPTMDEEGTAEPPTDANATEPGGGTGEPTTGPVVMKQAMVVKLQRLPAFSVIMEKTVEGKEPAMTPTPAPDLGSPSGK